MISVWLLILTMQSHIDSINGAAIDNHIYHIEFATEEQCKTAGRKWLDTNTSVKNKSAICVESVRFIDNAGVTK